MPRFNSQTVLTNPPESPIKIIPTDSPAGMAWGTANMSEITGLDPRVIEAQTFCLSTLPPGAQLRWFGVAYDDFGQHIRMIMGAENDNPRNCHLWVLNDPTPDGQLTIAEHHVDNPLRIVALSQFIGQRYLK